MDILKRLHMLHPKVIDLSLGRIETLLARLGHPERSLPPVIHVAGTNAKGSIIAYLRAMLEAAGKRVHVYTSPHLVRFNERIRVAGREISDADLIAVLEECERVNAGDPITFFEITTAAAFLAFSRTPADVVLLETGLGGRLDATNVIDKPALTVITPVSEDHQQYLGDDIQDIAGEKAAIMKPGVPCVLCAQTRNVQRLMQERARDIDAPLYGEALDWDVVLQGRARAPEGFAFRRLGPAGNRGDGVSEKRIFPMPGLVGGHQVKNAGAAVAAIQVLNGLDLGFDVPDSAIAMGLKTVSWPGRMQPLKNGPLFDLLPDDGEGDGADEAGQDGGWELWLDGGHNPSAAKAIAAQARAWRDKPLYLVFAMLRSKKPLDFLKPLEGRVELLRAVAIPGEDASLSAEEAAAAAAGWRMDAAPAADVAQAIRDIVANGSRPGRILIAGSLYLAGHVLKDNA
ncbi:bifunctional folylpolyglutamate synthase/dihydrofolate synthase [Varunaivibrio sulfuroxidans]|uniref:Dihydrofolate synthase/folylpolyglutamate synthase n=1 Tax=Varunaivibrio sulfuroxidans TaxID=1773489 RepID=A0A4R3J706_9PROT|nr:folylpolyglutamate synthase/dihydrofolate synthase family protein [Varunaivibrio sulfuroxidans]TCS61638.1 dihydrofolate synthase/folylpolyglutamate synthase [Varunaivibrio sulfuroxidans]WES29490.1 bifunctional folylpolyglutamate synthase/dihydrofolate synthase [Varunaivibrio sulfuroxidans]